MGPEALHAHPGAGFLLVGHVHRAGGIITHPQNRKTWRPAGLGTTAADLLGKALFQLLGQRFSIQSEGHRRLMHVNPACRSSRASVSSGSIHQSCVRIP